MKTSSTTFGYLPDGREVKLFRFKSENGFTVSITNYGGIITSVITPDKKGSPGEITAGFPDLESYLQPHPHFGVIVGRFANRIADGSFAINGKQYKLELNNGPNHLHGGNTGFHAQLWDYNLKEFNGYASLVLSYLSPHMHEGYPGNLKTIVTYTISDNNELDIHYQAETDEATHINLTSHSYFNLGGFRDTIFNHKLMINAEHYLELDDNQIPTGKYTPCSGSAFDYLTLGKIRHGMDHCFVLKTNRVANLPDAILFHPGSGRKLTMYCTQPGIQVYTSNSLDGSLTGHNGVNYNMHQAICLESQHFPDTPNKESFPSTLLKPGEIYSHTTRMVFES